MGRERPNDSPGSGNQQFQTTLDQSEQTELMEAVGRAAPGYTDATEIIHLTAAAAVKAAATALLTNQVVRKVCVNQDSGETTTFSVEKCVIEPGSALCSIAGPREAITPAGNSLEICVRVAWDASASIETATVAATEQILLVENSYLSLPIHSANELASDGSKGELNLASHIPISFYYVVPQTNFSPSFNLTELPRDLLCSTVAEVLESVAPARLEAGVRVVVSLVGVADTTTQPRVAVSQTLNLQANNYVNSKNIAQVVSSFEQCQTGNLVFALDTVGANAAPVLLETGHECFVQFNEGDFELSMGLTAANTLNRLHSLTLCGGINAILALACGETSQSIAQFNPTVLINLVQRREMDSALAQSLREVKTPEALMHLIRHHRLGWLFDEICRLACYETRKQLKRAVRLDVALFGNSGAVLGRASLEPGTFKI